MPGTASHVTLHDAILTFGRGFALTRSFTHPYEFLRVGPVWVLRDGPRTSGDERSQEILVHGMRAKDAHPHVVEAARGRRHFVCAIDDMGVDHRQIAAEYRSLGYRLLRREPMMVRPVGPPVDGGRVGGVVRIESAEEAAEIAHCSRTRLILPEHFPADSAPVRLFVARIDGQVAGWVRSVRTSRENAWVSHLFVNAQFRRQGLGRSLMGAMLEDDSRLGYQTSVLLASNTGHLLYQTLGYQQIGLLQLFVPPR